MKKFLSLMVVTLVGLLPFVVNAASSISPGSDCGQLDSEGNSRCTVHYKIDDQDGLTSMIITLTEKGGATVTNVDNIAGSEWTMAKYKVHQPQPQIHLKIIKIPVLHYHM